MKYCFSYVNFNTATLHSKYFSSNSTDYRELVKFGLDVVGYHNNLVTELIDNQPNDLNHIITNVNNSSMAISLLEDKSNNSSFNDFDIDLSLIDSIDCTTTEDKLIDIIKPLGYNYCNMLYNTLIERGEHFGARSKLYSGIKLLGKVGW